MNQDLQVPYLTPLEFAKRFRISRRTVYRLIKRGVIPVKRVGRQWRIPRYVLENFELPPDLSRKKQR
jgi:excisionase family DNA binding protein